MSQRFKNVFLKASPLFIDYISWIISYSESINFSPPSHSNKGTNVGICGYTQGNQWRRKWQPTPVLLPGKFLGWGSLVGYSPWGRKELDTTDRLHFLSFHSSLLGAGGEGDDRGWDGWMASLTRWTWVSVNSGSWWWTGRPGVLRFMGSQRVRHDWTTELNWMRNLTFICFEVVSSGFVSA